MARLNWRQGNVDAARDQLEQAKVSAARLDWNSGPAEVEVAVETAEIEAQFGTASSGYEKSQIAVRLAEETFGVHHPRVSESLLMLAMAFERQNEVEQSLEVTRRRLRILADGLEFLALDSLYVIKDLAVLHATCQRVDTATTLLGIVDANIHLTTKHARHLLAITHRQRGQIAFSKGDYSEAISWLQSATDLVSSSILGDPISNLRTMMTLGSAYTEIRDFESAAIILGNAINQCIRIHGRARKSTAPVFISAIQAFAQVGRFDDANVALLEVSRLRQEGVLSEFESVALSAAESMLLTRMGRHHEAFDALDAVRSISSSSLILRQQGAFRFLTYELELRFRLGDTLGAVADYDRLIDLFREDRRAVDELYMNKIKMMAKLGSAQDLAPMLKEIFVPTVESLHALANTTTDMARIRMASRLRFRAEAWTNLVTPHESPRRIYDAISAFKGIAYDVARIQSLGLDISGPPSSAVSLSLPQTIVHRGFLKNPPTSADELLRLEQQLLRLDQQTREVGQARQRVKPEQRRRTVADIQSHLRDDEMVLDFWSIRPDLLEYSLPEIRRQRRRVDCFVIKKESVERVALGWQDEIEAKIVEWRNSIALDDPLIERKMARSVAALVWEPLEVSPDQVGQVYVCPEGVLTNLPWSALPGATPEKYLIDDIGISVIPSAAHLDSSSRGSGLFRDSSPRMLLAGDIQFREPDSRDPSVSKQRIGLLNDRSKLHELPGTKLEIDMIESQFRTRWNSGVLLRLEKDRATEQVFRENARQFHFIHLATHGLFAPETLVSEANRYDTEKLFATSGIKVQFIHPGSASALVFCAPPAFAANSSDDGLLTALEAQDLRLRDAALVVLSACDTANGKFESGEGIAGLQRAFHIAGAQGVVSSLWTVNDEATAIFFAKFYELLWNDQLDPRSALRATQRWMIRNPQAEVVSLAERIPNFTQTQSVTRRSNSATSGLGSPRNWAAFVYSGGLAP
ncbi:MAG: CHAT domain-containing protein [Planctomycetes bacterium]|nr:CHAT domain-containing protein [Planctomycetota bacterium]